MKFPIVDQVIALVRKPGGARPRRDRDERLRAGFDAAPVGLAFATVDGHWLNVNERFRTIVGYTREELARISLDSLTHAEDAKKEAAMMRKLVAGDTDSYRIEKRVMDKRGKYRVLIVTVTCVRADNGEPEFLVYVVEEATPGQREAPRESHDRGMAWIVDQLPDICIIRTDDRGLITGWNSGAEKLFGYRKDEVIGKNRRILYRDADGWEGRPTSQLNSVADTGRLEFEDWRVQRDGAHVWVKCAITPFKPEGTVKGYVEVVTMPTGITGTLDLSHVKDAKQADDKKSAEMRQIVEALQSEVDLGRRKEESLRDALEQVRVMGEETMNELKIMTTALRKEIERRRSAEDELRVANERLEAASQPPIAVPEPPPPVVEEEIEIPALPAVRLWKTLDGTPPAELLVSHATEHHSGTLIMKSGDREKQIFFEKGKVFSVASNNPRKFLTQQLIELGYITEEQRQRALEIQQETHLALGRILLILGAVNEEQLIEVMRTKMEDEIADVFDWKDAQYTFDEGEVPSLQLVPLRIEVASLVVKRLNRTADSRQQTADEAAAPAPSTQHLPIVASPKSKKFHKETCNSVKKIGPDARALFASADEARDAGFEACRLCFR
ncbi:MAG TPA: PAS domain S-box protein [Thermoanaerobaculia bacterium]